MCVLRYYVADLLIRGPRFRYEPANRQTTADFLVAATDPGGRIPRPGVLRRPQTAIEFAEHFKNSKLGKLNREEVESYITEFVGKPDRADAFRQSARQEIAKGINKGRCAWFLIILRDSILNSPLC